MFCFLSLSIQWLLVYFPIRDLGNQLGLQVNWNEAENRIEVVDPTVQPREIYTLSGIIVEATDEENGGKLIHVMGRGQIGPIDNVKLHVTANTVIRSQDGKLLKPEDLKENMKIEVDYDTRLTRSLPPIGQAVAIRAEMERLVFNGAIEEVKETDYSRTLIVNPKGTDDPLDTVILHIGYDTKIVKPNGEEVSMEELKKRTEIRAFYGPIMTMSLPPQSGAELIIINTNNSESQ